MKSLVQRSIMFNIYFANTCIGPSHGSPLLSCGFWPAGNKYWQNANKDWQAAKLTHVIHVKYLRGCPFMCTVFPKRTMFGCRLVDGFWPSGCSFGKSKKICTPLNIFQAYIFFQIIRDGSVDQLPTEYCSFGKKRTQKMDDPLRKTHFIF